MHEAAIEALVGSYPQLTTMLPSSWVSLHNLDPDLHIIRLNDICHAGIKYLENPQSYHECLLAVPESDYLSLQYLDYLINIQFKQFTKYITLKQYFGDHYIHVTGLNEFPANAFYNFCIATRTPIENMPTLKQWANLVKLGLDPSLAMLIAGFGSPDQKITSLDDVMEMDGVPNTNHWWFDINLSWKNLIQAEPGNMSGPYCKDPKSCMPSNIMWGKSSAQITYNQFKKPLKDLKELYAYEA